MKLEMTKKRDFSFLGTKKADFTFLGTKKVDFPFLGTKKEDFTFLGTKKEEFTFLGGKNPFLVEKNCSVRPRKVFSWNSLGSWRMSKFFCCKMF